MKFCVVAQWHRCKYSRTTQKNIYVILRIFCVYRAKIANICRDLLLRLLERDDFYCAWDLIVFFRREMDDPLV